MTSSTDTANTKNLFILGAAYGLRNVTEQVRSLVKNNQLSFIANSSTLGGDNWPEVKSLVIVYQYLQEAPQTLCVPDNGQVTIKYTKDPSIAPDPIIPDPVPGVLTIVGAAYGLADVTENAKKKIQNNSLIARADNDTWGDSWVTVLKTLVVVYHYGKKEQPFVKIALENQQLDIQATPHLTILGAAYGLVDVSQKIRSFINNSQTINIIASNQYFGDSWPEINKSLVVVYQYSNEQPQVKIVQENQQLSITYSDAPIWSISGTPGTLIILGAAYGLENVTVKMRGFINNNTISVTATNLIFGDSWVGIRKSLVVVYQYLSRTGEGWIVASLPEVKIVEENNLLKIP